MQGKIDLQKFQLLTSSNENLASMIDKSFIFELCYLALLGYFGDEIRTSFESLVSKIS